MTLLALTLNHGNPVLMADVLFSSREGDGNLALPTFANGINEVLKVKDGFKAFALKQKIYIINDRLCIALAGGQDRMLTFHNRSKAFFPTVDFTEAEVDDFIINYPEEEKDNLDAIIVGSTDGNPNPKMKVWFIGDVTQSSHQLYGDVFAAGSGTSQFLQHIAETEVYEVDNSVDAPLINNLSLLGYWIGSDYVSPDSLRNHWGGGYELIIFKEGKFIKLDEYVIVVLYAEIGEGIEFISRPMNTIMSNYQKDDLIIRSFSFNEEHIFGIPPIYKEDTHFSLLPADPHYQNLLGVYVVKSHYDGKFYCPSFTLTQNQNELTKTPIKIERVGDKLRVYTSKSQDKYMHDHLLKVIKRAMIK